LEDNRQISPLLCLFVAGFFIWCSLSAVSQALEIDEKLTLRLLRTSTSKKTILINRGLEDGLAVGDHAKFYLTTGIVARGVLSKASPSRSIWSLYRVIDGEQLAVDKVMNLKVATPVKLTEDRTKMLSPDNSNEGAYQIPIAPGAEETVAGLSKEDESDLAGLQQQKDDMPAVSLEENIGLAKGKTLEFWGILHFSGLSSSSDRGTDGSSSGSNSTIELSAGLEKYFSDTKTWLHDISIFGIVHYSGRSIQTVSGEESSLTALEYGVGVNWHFWADPFVFNKPIGFFTASLGVGKTEEVFSINNSTTTTTGTPVGGTSSFMAVGAGFKYYLSKGVGFRGVIDYYRRGERYVFDGQDTDFSKVVSGPRIMVGLSYRW